MRLSKVILLLAICLLLSANLSATKYAGEIFKMGAGVRNFALGRTGVTDNDSPALAYWNASLLLNQTGNSFEVMHAEEFNGILKYDTFSFTLGDANFAWTLSRIGIDNVYITKLPDQYKPIGIDNQPYIDKAVSNTDYILYLAFARQLGKFPLGITPKLVHRTLAETTAFGFGMDISSHLQANEHFMFGLRIRDIVPTQIYWENGTREVSNIGADIEMQIKTKLPVFDLPLTIFANGEINTEGIKEYSTVNIGDVSLDPHIGLELALHERISLFFGYDIEYFTTGAGINFKQFLLNYAFEQNSNLDNSHRVSVGYKF